jgi:hypothetical protein
MEQTVCSKTSAIKTQTPGNYPKETIQHRYVKAGTNRCIDSARHKLFIEQNEHFMEMLPPVLLYLLIL